MSKRGISPLIATVMLVGFAVALGAMVSTFLIKEAKDFKPESFLEDSPFCEGVVLEPLVLAAPNNPGNCQVANQPKPRWPRTTNSCPLPNSNQCIVEGIVFRNKGSFSIHSVWVSGTGVSNQVLFPARVGGAVVVAPLPPGKTWGVTATANEFRNPILSYIPQPANQPRVLKITPRVVDPEKTAEAREADSNSPNVIVPC